MFDNLQRVWDFLKRQPTTKDMSAHPSNICFTTYYNHFGSWKKAIESFVEYKNNGSLVVLSKKDKRAKRKSLTNSLRYDIMKRDFFKCVLCGQSPSTNPSIILEIDHVIAITNGGDNSNDNLQTLCSKCNNGKLNK